MGTRKDSQQGDIQTIELHLSRGVVIVLGCMLLVAAVVGYLAQPERKAAASGAQSSAALAGTLAKYYLTTSTVTADQALTACAAGYHMASMWEILDPTNLEYDSSLGWMTSDSGSGPPSAYYGWVRNGYNNASSTNPGSGNCFSWTTGSDMYYGTRVRLPTNWTTAAVQSAPWEADAEACNSTVTHVWCVED